LAWEVEYLPVARKAITRLDNRVATRIVAKFEGDVLARDPRTLGEALACAFAGLRRVRIGDYRVIFRIEAERVTVLVVKVAHRREAYR